MKNRVYLFAVFCISIVASQAPAQTATTTRARNYISGTAVPEMTRIVPPAPVNGDPRDTADREVFRATRALEGSARWRLANSDDSVSSAGLFRAFSCAVGVDVNNQNAPGVVAFLGRVSADVNSVVGSLKDFYQRKRPFLVDEGAICVARSTGLTNSFDYPSGHTTAGWTFGLVLAEMIPERSTYILARARAYGESRVVCGVHNVSAIEAGRVAATAMITVLHSSESFRSDMNAARTELERLRSSVGPAPESCTVEASTLATRPF